MGSPSLMEFAEPEALLQAIFEFQCLLRGEPKARDIFRRAMHRSPKKRGENREMISGETLLAMYDGFVADNPGTPPFTKAEAPGAFAWFTHMLRPTNAVAAKGIGTLSQSAGASAQAIEKRLRRLLNARERSRQEAQKRADAQRPRPTVLSGLGTFDPPLLGQE